ncbi:glycosyltransferase family 4 protein [Pyrodictium occultum]|uniref:glycosyltransferase family 4 protein n=1 Tax=Pyrodictium occultum TaxID=2309 RepID=UPI0009F99C9E|nr:glycosyltransferase family 4 protein [Pyrodictium occultum]
MKPLIIAPNDLRIREGTTIRITGLIKSIAPNMEKIYLASAFINKELSQLHNLEWVKIRFLRALTLLSINYSSIMSRHFFDIGLTRIMINKEIRDADVIHAHWILTLPLAVGIHKYNGAPIIVDLHGLFELQSQSPSISLAGWLLVNLSRIIEVMRVRDKYIEAFTVPSEPLKQYLIRRYGLPGDKIFVVPDGIDINDIPSYDEDLANQMRNMLGIKDEHVVAYVGTVSYFHGFHDLLKAFKIAKHRIENIKLLLIVPNRVQALNIAGRTGISDQDLIVLENIPRRKIYYYLYLSDVLVIPHRAGTQFEFLPSNKLLDYIASGKPIVGYDLPSIRHLLYKYEPKILVKPNDPEALASGIINALQINRRAPYKVIKAVLSKYSWNNVGKQLLSVYRRVKGGIR